MNTRNRILFVLSAVFLFCLTLGLLIYQQIHISENRVIKEKFDNRISSFVYTFQERYRRNETVMKSVKGFIASSDFVNQKEWNTYYNSIGFAKNFPALDWIGFVKLLEPNEESAFIKKYEEEEKVSIKMWPEGTYPIDYPLLYIGPEKYLNLRGFNFASSPVQKEVLDESVKENQILSTVPITSSVTKSPKKTDRLLCLPVIKDSKVTGWVVAVIDFLLLTEKVAKGTQLEGINIDVYKGDQIDPENLFFSKTSQAKINGKYTKKQTIEFAGLKWTFVFKTNENFLVDTSGIYPLFLFFFLVFGIFGLLTYLYFRLRKISSFAPGDTHQALMILGSMQYSVIATDLNGKITYINAATQKLLGYSPDEMIGKMTPEQIHDPAEMKSRAEELSSIFNKTVQPNFEVFVALNQRDISENRRWNYIRKDKTVVNVQLSITTIKDINNQPQGYLGVAIDVSELKF